MCDGTESKHEKRASDAEPVGSPAGVGSDVSAENAATQAREEQRLLEEQRDERVHSSQAKIRVVGING